MDTNRSDSLSRAVMRSWHRADEGEVLKPLVAAVTFPAEMKARIRATGVELVERARLYRPKLGQFDDFLKDFGLSTPEGLAVMCVAEALLRVPDAQTQQALLEEKIGRADWQQHRGQGDTLLANMGAWALAFTGRAVSEDEGRGALARLMGRGGAPLLRSAMRQAMKVLGTQFVIGRHIEEALDNAADRDVYGYRWSFDLLGEAAVTAADAKAYFDGYLEAIDAIAAERQKHETELTGPGLSVKLSALHPRYTLWQRDRVQAELFQRLRTLALRARAVGIGLTVDAEESERLELSLDLFEAVFRDPELDGWEGFGLAVQAYSRRCLPTVDWLAELARQVGRRLPVRLVKGAYWDSEIKWAQEQGLADYPVFTRKASTDVCYLACARRLLERRDVFYPMFATHNAQTVASILEMAPRFGRGGMTGFEFQRLWGMGEPVYRYVVHTEGLQLPVRIYAPVGKHGDLLAYLVRRLIENGANSSFINRLQDKSIAPDELVEDPVEVLSALEPKRNPRLPRPPQLYAPHRQNSASLDLYAVPVLQRLEQRMVEESRTLLAAAPIVSGRSVEKGEGRAVAGPADLDGILGTLHEADEATVQAALAAASGAARGWALRPLEERAACLDKMAELLEDNGSRLMAMLAREAGRTVPDALSELREAVDFCRYYAAEARRTLRPQVMPGPTGESNVLAAMGRGVFLCISPWNFPLAIFTGQVAAALVAGNAVLAKPAEQTPAIANAAVQLFLQAGIPTDVLHLLPGRGETVGARLVGSPAVDGVCFTGSFATARAINRSLAERRGPIVPLIAETGGQNVMIVDSTALPEQVARDVVASAFRSAGQRCSALRLLALQDDVADTMIATIRGAAMELRIGDPALISSDIGPIIDAAARNALVVETARLRREARLLFELPLPAGLRRGHWFAPIAFEIAGVERLGEEIFGPVLQVVRYRRDGLPALLEAIDATRYGLTCGVQSRLESTVQTVSQHLRVGNLYVNRSTIGAVVGTQPFGGEGLSGTGPKAGGPHYLQRFVTERHISIDTTASGGNASLIDAAGGA